MKLLEIFILTAISVLAGTGAFLLLANLFRVPKLENERLINSVLKQRAVKESRIDTLTKWAASKLSKIIRLNPYKKLELQDKLQSAQTNITPELFLANALVKALAAVLPAIAAWAISPAASVLFLAAAVVMFLTSVKSLNKEIEKKREAIEYELPRFAYTIKESVKNDPNVLNILTKYRDNTCPELAYELAITVADMKTGNQEEALNRMDRRVGSSMLSELSRGLIGSLRGDQTVEYWDRLSERYGEDQKQKLKRRALKIPGKIEMLSYVILACFAVFALTALLYKVLTDIALIG